MKRFFLCTFLLITAFIIGCTEDEPVLFGDIHGQVKDSQTSQPIANANVTITPNNRATTTGGDGTFSFTSLDSGSYTVSVKADGYEPKSSSVTVIPGQNVSCDILLSPVVVNNVLEFDHTDLSFGTSQTQLSIVITNAGAVETDWNVDLSQNTWLTASPKSGRIGAGKSQTIVFTASRAGINEETSGVISISAFGNSTPIAVSISPSQQASSVMEVEPLDLDFGDQSTEQTIRIKNKGTADLEWSIYGIAEEALSVSAQGGTVQPDNSTVVSVMVDRTMVTENIATSFIVSDGTNEQVVNVVVLAEQQEEEEEEEEPQPQGAIELSTTSLDFGSSTEPQTFTITNVGEGVAEWEITDIQPNDIITCSPTTGTLEAGQSATVSVSVNIEAITTIEFSGSFSVGDGINTYGVTVLASNPANDISDGQIQLSTTELDFSDNVSSLTFDVTNAGSTYLSWTASDVPSYITFESGTLTHKQADGATKTITLTLDRLAMPDEVDAEITLTNDYNAEDTHKIHILAAKLNSKITYTTVNNQAITIFKAEALGDVMSHTYADGVGTITLRGKINRLGDEAFANSTTISSMTLPEGVTSIGKSAFLKCINMATIDIPSTVDYIGDNAFQECLVLDNVVIPEGVTVINRETFWKCTGLTTITIPNSVTRIGHENNYSENGVFRDCTSLTTITLPNSVTEIGYYAFRGSGITTITLSNKLERIGSGAFEDCTSLQEITLPNSLIEMRQSAFKNCTSLAHITIPASVAEIPSECFNGCSNMATATIPEGVTTIGSDAFNNTQLTTITIPSTVTAIGTYAFETNCMQNVYCKPAVPPSMVSYWLPFGRLENLRIYVPTYSVYLYQTADGWSEYADRIVGYDF